MSSGKAIVVTMRRVVDGLTFRVSSAEVTLRLLPAVIDLPALTEPVVDVDMMSSSVATGVQSQSRLVLTFVASEAADLWAYPSHTINHLRIS
jgi:hypothetical protein